MFSLLMNHRTHGRAYTELLGPQGKYRSEGQVKIQSDGHISGVLFNKVATTNYLS